MYVLTLFFTIGGVGILYTYAPSELMNVLHAFIGTIIKNSAIAGFLSSLKYISANFSL